jgi:DNA-binding transcriptional LysR family regulator
LTELGKHNCLKFRKTSGAVQDWLFATQAQPAAPVRPYPTRGNLISDDGGALINAALDGLGLFQAHDYAVDDLLRTGRLVEVLRAFAASGPELFVLIAPGKRGSAKVRAFVQLLLHSLAMT